MRLLLGALIIVAALSGCTDSGTGPVDSVQIQTGDVNPDSHHVDHISCGDMARLSVDATAGDGGDFNVNVRGGAGYTVFASAFSGTDDSTFEEDLPGGGGLWEIRVDRTLEHDGTFTVTLTCL